MSAIRAVPGLGAYARRTPMSNSRKVIWLCLSLVALANASHGQSFKTLASFYVGYPQYMSLVQAADGSLYGTTPADWGVVFKVTTGGLLTPVCSFGYVGCPD